MGECAWCKAPAACLPFCDRCWDSYRDRDAQTSAHCIERASRPLLTLSDPQEAA